MLSTQAPTTATSERFWCVPSRHGVHVVCQGDLIGWESAQGPARSGILPDAGDDSEPAVGQPPLPVALSREEIAELRSNELHSAATSFGPEQQDKSSNQDFALSAELVGTDEYIYTLAIVADGVSTKTLWAERTARLACLASYKFIRIWLAQNSTPFEEEAIQRDGPFRIGLIEAIRDALLADQRLLNGLRFASPAWAPDIYGGAMGDNSLWYNSTLLIACLGGNRGLYVSVGDGGAVLFRETGEKRDNVVLLRSDDTLTIEHAVNLQMNANKFSMRRIGLENARSATMILSSDGTDRTVQRSNGALKYADLAQSGNASTLREFLRQAETRDPSEVEIDNMSVALARAPRINDRPRPSNSPVPEFCTFTPADDAGELLTILPASTSVDRWSIAQARADRTSPTGTSTLPPTEDRSLPPATDVTAGESNENIPLPEPDSATPAEPKQDHAHRPDPAQANPYENLYLHNDVIRTPSSGHDFRKATLHQNEERLKRCKDIRFRYSRAMDLFALLRKSIENLYLNNKVDDIYKIKRDFEKIYVKINGIEYQFNSLMDSIELGKGNEQASVMMRNRVLAIIFKSMLNIEVISGKIDEKSYLSFIIDKSDGIIMELSDVRSNLEKVLI